MQAYLGHCKTIACRLILRLERRLESTCAILRLMLQNGMWHTWTSSPSQQRSLSFTLIPVCIFLIIYHLHHLGIKPQIAFFLYRCMAYWAVQLHRTWCWVYFKRGVFGSVSIKSGRTLWRGMADICMASRRACPLHLKSNCLHGCLRAILWWYGGQLQG